MTSRPPRISLCLIARDEVELLPACLASVAGAVDELVVVDTGSTDGTVGIARAAGAKVVAFPWRDDFAAARNEALRHATGAFILQLDADERLAEGATAAIRAAVAEPGAGPDAWLLRLHDADREDATDEEVLSGRARAGPPGRLPRLLRRGPGLAWAGVVHESVSDWLAARGLRTALLDADIVHLGHVEALRQRRGKGARNVGLLRRRCALEPDSVTPIGYLALELIRAGDANEAPGLVERGWSLVPTQPRDRSILRLAVARALVALREGRPDDVLEAARLGLEREGPQPDLLHLRGRALAVRAAEAPPVRHAALEAAALAFQGALACSGQAHLRQYVAGACSHASWTGLGEVRLAQGLAEAAAEPLQRALDEAPSSEAARLGLAEVRLALGDAAGALAALEPLLGERPDGWALAAAAARALGAGADARLLADQARRRAARGYWAEHRRALVDLA